MGEQAALGKGGLLTPAPSPGGRESRCPHRVIPLGRRGCRLRISCFQSLHSKITSLGDTWSPPLRAPSGQLENITLDGTGKHSRPGTKIPDSGPSRAPGVHGVSVLGQATSLSVSASLPLTQEVEQPLPHLRHRGVG